MVGLRITPEYPSFASAGEMGGHQNYNVPPPLMPSFPETAYNYYYSPAAVHMDTAPPLFSFSNPGFEPPMSVWSSGLSSHMNFPAPHLYPQYYNSFASPSAGAPAPNLFPGQTSSAGVPAAHLFNGLLPISAGTREPVQAETYQQMLTRHAQQVVLEPVAPSPVVPCPSSLWGIAAEPSHDQVHAKSLPYNDAK